MEENAHNVCTIEYRIVFCIRYRNRVLYGNIAEKRIEVIRGVYSASYVDINNKRKM